MEKTGKATVQIDNERVRVTAWNFAPGEATGHHRHEMDYVVVPLTTGRLLIRNAEGEHMVELQAGATYTRDAGIEHDVINPGPGRFAFVEIELKR
jgi:mannose-6-phosphate isomerase-like protein (cupin superfamily)